jgi:hypothetical protein
MSSPAGVPGTSSGSNCKLKRAAVYVRRRPERSAAYQVVRENLETRLAERRAGRLAECTEWLGLPMLACPNRAISDCCAERTFRNIQQV